TTRDFTYVEDTCRGFMSIAGLEDGLGEVFHIGSGQEISIGTLFETIAELMGSDARAAQDPERMRPSGSEVMRLCCDNKKLYAAAGFKPGISLREGLARTIEWFRDAKNLSKYKERIYNV